MLQLPMKFLILILLFVVQSANAQDIIFLKTGEEILAKVIAINPTDIQYRKHNDKDGPLYTRYKSEVFMIKYANGSKDVFTQESSVATNPNSHIDAATQREVKAGTQINVMLVNELNSKLVTAGQTIEFQVVTDIIIDQKKVILGGQIIQATVINSEKAKGLGKEGKLDIQLTQVLGVDGQVIPLTGVLSKAGENRTTESVAIGALLFWPVLFMKGKEAVLPAGSRFIATVSQTVVVNIN